MLFRSDKHVVALKKITGKGSKAMTEADHRERDRLEWLGGLYWSEDLQAIALPSDNIERCLFDGAKKSKKGKDFQAAILVTETEVVIDHRMKGETPEAMRANPAYTLRTGIKVKSTQGRIMRIRPMIPTGWSLKFTAEYDPHILSESAIIQAANDAGSLIGLGDWRPKFGRFAVEVLR